MRYDRDYVDVPRLFDALLEILPKLMKAFMTKRRHVKQASVLGGLSAYLLVIQGEEDELSTDAMNELELICTWPNRSINTTECHTPTLRALAAPASTEEFLKVSEAVSTSLYAFASATPKQRERCKQFAKARTSADASIPAPTSNNRVSRPAKQSVTPDDYPKFVNMMLYETMRKYTNCHCEPAWETNGVKHGAKLCLWNRPHVAQGLVDFDMHFWSQSYRALTQRDCHWQQLRLHVPSKRAELKKVHVQTPTECGGPLVEKFTPRLVPESNSEPDTLSNNDFCVLLNNSIGPAKVRPKVFGSSLLRLHDPDETDQVLINKPSVSLAQVLQQHRLSTKTKVGLAYTLARSVWQYYDSEWMGSGWTSKNIHFMLESSDDFMHSCVYASKPCLTVQFQSRTESLPERWTLPGILHRYPRVLALGTLLVEIAHASYDGEIPTISHTQVHKANNEYMKGRKTCYSNPSWPDLGTADAARLRLRTVYKTATQSCFDFKNVISSTNPEDIGIETEKHRKDLYEKVVEPLEDIIDEMGWTHSLTHIEAIEFNEANSPANSTPKLCTTPFVNDRSWFAAMQRASSDSPRLQRQDNLEYHETVLFDDGMPVAGHNPERCEAFSQWKARFNSVYEHFIPKQLTSLVPSVKIAVLNTGIDLDNEYIEAHKERISGHNWLTEPKSKRLNDKHGHGTHIAGLILDLIPHSQLYIAKVTDGGDADPETLAGAIDYAVEQQHDIISISIGFSQKVRGYEHLESAIERALYEHVLTFAAASNGGGNNDRAYPAREKQIFCIHSTDAKGTRSKFSPTAEDFGYNFATIGEAVESFWPTHLCADGEQAVRVKSGTSFATPIGASIAAFLLLYARVYLKPEQAARLKRYSAMESLLHEVSKGSRAKKDRDDYQYLFLSRHPDTFFGRETEEINNTFRKCN